MLQMLHIIVRRLVIIIITQPSIKKFNLINNYMVSKYNCWVLELILTSNRSTMVSCDKNNKTIFEILSSFQMGAVCFFSCANGVTMFIPCATVQCIVPTYSCSVIHGLLQGCYN